ncbi:hypothetical protein QBC44DRAFT_372021 [Cladorrhinum sp. PSN332]|nr:hypothetical protein QBC44DRAFT_372021 [Cladorrhinum sp. PSN332]
MVSAKLFAGLAALAITASAAPVTDESPIPGYSVEVLEWEVQATPDSAPIHVNGTVEDVIAELVKINPDFAVAEDSIAARDSGLSKRYDIDSSFCFGRWPAGRELDLQTGIRNLRAVSGRPQRGPGPGSCGRVSCTGRTGIWWCNDNTSLKYLNSFGDIANGAQHIDGKCRKFANTGVFSYWEVSGQVFYKDNWNVYVRGQDTC